jgi:NMD protein affecting ribosome stability and mRNA decay
MKEKCTRCGRETEYEVSAPVTERRYYIEGSGQLCEKCFYELYPVPGALRDEINACNTPAEGMSRA